MERADVLIVGGGPAGSTCAWKLARAGLDVLVVDRATFPRDKTCAGWITPAVVEELELDLDAYARDGRVVQPFHGFAVGLIGEPPARTGVKTPRATSPHAAVEIDYGRPVSYGIRRFELDAFLLARSGARVRAGTPARTFERRGDRWVVNGELEAPLVVGAGGHFCPVARFLGDDHASTEPVVVAQEIELRSPELPAAAVAPELPLLAFCRDLRGYGWVERKGEWWNVGLGRQDPRALSAHVNALVDDLAARKVVPATLPRRFQGHAYLLYEPPPRRRLVGQGMLLLGDAAGLAHRRSGEGIRTAVESAVLAAKTIVRAVPDFRTSRLEPYARALADRLGGKEQLRWERARALLPARLGRLAAATLLSSRWFARRVVLDRWFFHSDQEPLVA